MIVWRPSRPAEDIPSIDVSDDAEPPWERLSPNYQHGQIPIPGMPRMLTECVQGAMEGLKLISKQGLPGKLNPGYFVGPGREREVKADEWLLGWSYEGRRLSLPEARRLIFIPAYVWTLQNKTHGVLAKLKLLGRKHDEDGLDLVVYDGVPGDDLDDYETPLSAAAILVAYANDQLAELLQPAALQ